MAKLSLSDFPETMKWNYYRLWSANLGHQWIFTRLYKIRKLVDKIDLTGRISKASTEPVPLTSNSNNNNNKLKLVLMFQK